VGRSKKKSVFRDQKGKINGEKIKSIIFNPKSIILNQSLTISAAANSSLV